MDAKGGKAGIVLAGGGARAAYQVGVQRAMKETGRPTVAPIPSRSSAAPRQVPSTRRALAVHADDFALGVDHLLEVWRHFQPHHVYRADFPGVMANSGRWLAGFLFGAFLRNKRISLLDNRPLESLLARRLDFTRIQSNIEAGVLDAVSITCSGYTSGQSCSFFQATAAVEGWQRQSRVGVRSAHRGRAPDGLQRHPVPLSRAPPEPRVFRRRLDAPDRARQPGAAPGIGPRGRGGHRAHQERRPAAHARATTIPRSRRSRATC